MSYAIAVDGPAGAGKSTVSKEVAKKLGIEYIDTGAMYRALTLKLLENNIDIKDIDKLNKILKETKIDFNDGHIYLDGRLVDEEIRETRVTLNVSDVSALTVVREKLVDSQREIAKNKSVIMDGRDIGTNVLIDAEYKFYLNASLEERARRRYEEIKDRGETYEGIKEDIRVRDDKDKSRKIAPLKKAKDAIEIDSTSMMAKDVINLIIDYVKKDERE